MEITMKHRAVGTAGLATVLFLASITQAFAGGLINRESYSGEYAFSYDDCGFWVDVASEFGGRAQFRVGTGPDDGAFFVHDNYWGREVHVRRGTTDSVVISGDGLFQETRGTRVEGTVFLFESVNAGQPFVVTDADGDVVLRDRGVIRQTLLFDTLGDDMPGGVVIAEVDLDIGGPHPGFFGVDLCPLLD